MSDLFDAPVRDTQPMTVANMTFMVNKLAKECAPLQFIRELTQNSIEGILAGDSKEGEIRWDVDWNSQQLSGTYKLAIIDTGVGMTGQEMETYINKMSSSMHDQSDFGNFGVGAKISAVPLNPEGLIYLSWKGGQGYMIHLWYDADANEYGLKRFENGEFWTTISDSAIKPEPIEENGTMVILMGQHTEDNTMTAPPGTPMPSRWILRYLNSRYFRFPEGITIKTREGWELPRSNTKHNFLREVHGQGPWLDANSESKGTVELEDAKAYWWIINPEVDSDSGHHAGAGHVAALYQNELYEMKRGNAGYARLQSFGVIFGTERVVLYVEPNTENANGESLVAANTARTQLHQNGEQLPWTDWATEFREKMPEELVDLQDEIAGHADSTDYKKAITDRLKSIMDLLKFTRYRPSKTGDDFIDPDETNAGGEPASGNNTRSGKGKPGTKGGRAGGIYALFADEGVQPAEGVGGITEPDVVWKSEEEGTRNNNDLADRAARYLPDQNLIIANGDFRVFTDMQGRWEKQYEGYPAAHVQIRRTTREWFEQQLKETVMSALALRGTGKWSIEELSHLWSEEALTACVLPRYHIDASIKRVLGQRLGTLKNKKPNAA